MRSEMTERDWDTFFDLLGKIINLPGKSADEKADEVRDQASRRQSQGDLDEFLAEMSE
jgi:hypothetical protein